MSTCLSTGRVVVLDSASLNWLKMAKVLAARRRSVKSRFDAKMAVYNYP